MTAGIDSSTFSNLDKWKKGGWTDLEGIKFYNVKVFKDSNKNAIKKKFYSRRKCFNQAKYLVYPL